MFLKYYMKEKKKVFYVNLKNIISIKKDIIYNNGINGIV